MEVYFIIFLSQDGENVEPILRLLENVTIFPGDEIYLLKQ
jgi:hypothetical protein